MTVAHEFDDLSLCTRCWRTRQDIVNERILVCEPTNVVPLEHAQARREIDAFVDQVFRLMAEMGVLLGPGRTS